jgi:hypothetical protein
MTKEVSRSDAVLAVEDMSGYVALASITPLRGQSGRARETFVRCCSLPQSPMCGDLDQVAACMAVIAVLPSADGAQFFITRRCAQLRVGVARGMRISTRPSKHGTRIRVSLPLFKLVRIQLQDCPVCNLIIGSQSCHFMLCS